MKAIKRIDLSRTDGQTLGVMKYADEHPEARFDHTEVYDAMGRFILMVSEYEPTDMDELCEWCDVPNGWQREQTIQGVWVCRKGERHIIITA